MLLTTNARFLQFQQLMECTTVFISTTTMSSKPSAKKGAMELVAWQSEVYWPAWEMHCNNLRSVLGLGLVRVSSRVRVRVRIRVKVRVSVLVRVSIRTSRVVNFALFRCYRPVIYTRPRCFLGCRLCTQYDILISLAQSLLIFRSSFGSGRLQRCRVANI